MTASPHVSVVVPTRDRARSLDAVVADVARQEATSVELVVVDDGSLRPVESTLDVPAGLAARIVRHELPRGVAAARNAGIAAARAGWIAFLDDDDRWSPSKLRLQLEAAEAECADFVYASAVLVDDRLRPLELVPAPDPASLASDVLRRNVVPAGSSNVVARTWLLRDLGGFDESFAHLDDWDLWIRLAGAGRAAACEEVLVAYVQHRGSRLLGDQGPRLHDFDRLVAKHAAATRALEVGLDRRRFLRDVAWAYRRAGRRLPAARTYMRAAWRTRSIADLARATGTLLSGGSLHPRRAVDAPAPSWLTE